MCIRDSYKSIINPILELINDEEKLIHLGKNGREIIRQNFSWEIITERIYEIYTNLLKNG